MTDVVELTLPVRSESATLVLTRADDPRSTARDLAEAVGTDAVLSARVLMLANSSFYGLSGRVGRLEFAVSVLGFTTVRALALATAADVAGRVPDGFWEHAALAATSADQLAGLFDAEPPDAFCLGLLHGFGTALLHQQQPVPGLCTTEDHELATLVADERASYGIDHAAFGALVLRDWMFPDRLCAGVAGHHDVPDEHAEPLERVLFTARVCADWSRSGRPPAVGQTATVERISGGRLVADDLPTWLERIGERAAALCEGLARL
ncbi:MAG: HDOD domain-containing protein [Jatrophihabitans sp.]|uniref:HDOD domain-containing protein n=1 Tax=Jatrophihabitans sp. TaxID=1932789 RepID=UPI003F7CF615